MSSLKLGRKSPPARDAWAPTFKWTLFFLLFGLSLLFAFGIGYRAGSSRPQSIPPAGVETSRAAASKSSREAAPPRIWQGAAPATPQWVSAHSVKYTLYFATFKKFPDAEKEKMRLQAGGLAGVEIFEKKTLEDGGVSWYRLRYGRFSDRQAAVDYGRQMVARGLIRDFWPAELP